MIVSSLFVNPKGLLLRPTYISIDIVRVDPIAANAIRKIDPSVVKTDYALGRNIDISLLVVVGHRLAAD